MAEKIVSLLKKLFDYQKFEQDESLNHEINGIREKAKDYILEDSNLAAVVGGVSYQNEQPGLECPRCHAFISTTMEQVIKGGALICPHCDLHLTIDPIKTENK